MRLVAFLTLLSVLRKVRYRTLSNDNPNVLLVRSEGASHPYIKNGSTRGSVGLHLGPGAIPTFRFSMKTETLKFIGSFNCQGLATSEVKCRLLADDFERKRLSILAVQETHLKGHGVIELKSMSDKQYKLHYSGHKTKSENGVGFIVERDRKVTFDPISDRICKLTTKINNSETLEIICAYAPTLERSEAKPELREAFYTELDSVVQKLKSRNACIIAGDFNAKTGSACHDKLYNDVIGKYGKGDANSNGIHLLNFAKLHNFKLTNTFHKHKPAHITTWEEPNHINGRIDANSQLPRRNPYRNQIDYILTVKDFRGISIFDSRSYGGMSTTSDHKLVMLKCSFKWPYTKRKKIENVNIDYTKFNDINVRNQYQEEVSQLLAAAPPATNNQERWNNIVKSTTLAAMSTAGPRNRMKTSTSAEVIRLSAEQKLVKNQIDCSKDPVERKTLRCTRNNKLQQIHQILHAEKRSRIAEKIESIEKENNDSRRMFSVIKEINREKPKVPLLIKTREGDMTSNDAEQCELIADHFKKQFFKEAEQIKLSNPQAMRNPFTSSEISSAINKLRNNRSSGLDNVTAELLKYGPAILHDEIALIFNSLAETGDCPREIVQGILCALQKPGKTKGPLDHLRPIILLSMLRKILAICLKSRTIKRIDCEIPPSQAAYRSGRSTTEHVFAVKVLCEKAISAKNFTIYLRLLDMSKAFDSVNRSLLIKDFEKSLEPDEVQLIKQMLDVELTVRCGKEMSAFFKTDTGVPQGDGYSANEFTYYLANSLSDQTIIDHDYAAPVSIHMFTDHDYAALEESIELDVDMEYADDITYVTTCGKLFTIKRNEITNKLKARNLNINATKTEEYVIVRNGDVKWKKCKLLGSLLDTAEDIVRRKGLAIAAIKAKKEIFYSDMDVIMKMRAFNVYVGSIFLYNCELWGLTDTQRNSIDAFHRRLLRTAVLNVRWPRKVSNVEVYERTRALPWSNAIQTRQLSWFGHLIRLDDDTPAKIALRNILQPFERLQGRPPTTWLSSMQKLFNEMGLTWQGATEAAKDKLLWMDIIT